MTRALTAAGFAGAILAFALPFGAVSSCEGGEVRFTGVELATFSVSGDSYSDRELASNVEHAASPFAIAALASAGAALVLLILGLAGVGLCSALGLLAIQLVLYGIVMGSDDGEILRGYWLALSGFAVAGLACLAAAIDARDDRDASVWPPVAVALAVLIPPLGLFMSATLAGLVWIGRRVSGWRRGRPAPSSQRRAARRRARRGAHARGYRRRRRAEGRPS